MPRLSQKLPSYRLHRASGKAIVTLDGRDHYLGGFGTPESRAEYDRLIREWLANGRRLARTPTHAPTDPTINELILAFWKSAERDYLRPDGTFAPELDNLRLAIRPLREQFGSLPAVEFGPLRLKALQDRLADSGLCRRTVNQRIRRVVRLFAWAESQEVVPRGLHQSLKTVPGLRQGRSAARESKVVRPVPDAAVDAVRPFLSRQLRAIVELQRLTGMRSGEAVIMRTCDLDTSGPLWEYIPERHKTEHHGKQRRIFLGPRAQEVVRPWLRTNSAEYLFQPREAMEERWAEQRRARKTPMTPSQRARRRTPRPRKSPGDRYDSRAYAHAVARACDRAFPHPTISKVKAKDRTPEQREELKAWRRRHRWHPHQLRHNAATQLRREFGLEVARVILGHSTVAATEIYAEQDFEKARGAMARIG